MTHLDLFSGIGGFALAAQWNGFRTVAFCEKEPYAQQVLRERFRGVPIHADICTLNGADYRGVALVTGGFPCQPFSVAGKRRGKEDDRHLWPEMLRVIAQARPAWVVGENVAGIINMELDSVLSDLESEGYAARPFVIPACGVDAKHRRNRVWIVAKSNAERCGRRAHDQGQETPERIGHQETGAMAHDAGARLQHNRQMQTGSELAGRNAVNGSCCDVPDANGPRRRKRRRWEAQRPSWSVSSPSRRPPGSSVR